MIRKTNYKGSILLVEDEESLREALKLNLELEDYEVTAVDNGKSAIKSFKEEGIETVLINPNIATVQTDDDMADKVYFQPLDVETVSKILKREKPDAIAMD